MNTHLALPQKCPSPICFSECNPKSYTERSSEDQRETHMHITFELETALQWEFKVFLFVRHSSHYQMGTNYLVFQNFCIHFPFSDFSCPCKSLQECCPPQIRNSRISLTDSKGTVCSYSIVLSQVAKSLQHNFQA